MKPYTIDVEINLPRDRVIELFDNPDNLFKWQTGLQSFEHLSGEPGQPGATSKLVYLNGKHRIELIETVTHRNLPDEFNGTYAWGGGKNTLVNRFIELGPDKTKWESTCEYEFSSLMLKLMGILFPGKFREQNLMFMRNFKAFAEEGHDVRESQS
ncbi:MAG: SRPBCC family protein [Pirellulaceae bacterium]